MIWFPGPSMPKPLAYHSLTQLDNGDVAILGGYNHEGHGTTVSQTFKFYCMDGNCQYEQGLDLNIPRYGHVALRVPWGLTGNPLWANLALYGSYQKVLVHYSNKLIWNK